MPRQCLDISIKLVIDLKTKCFTILGIWLFLCNLEMAGEIEKGVCMDFDLKRVPGHENDIAVVGSLKMSV